MFSEVIIKIKLACFFWDQWYKQDQILKTKTKTKTAAYKTKTKIKVTIPRPRPPEVNKGNWRI